MAERDIQTRFRTKCSKCQGPIIAGEEVVYNDVTRKVRHHEGLCMVEFIVECRYHASTIRLRIDEYTAERALDKAEKDRGKASKRAGISREAMKSAAKDKPEAYICYRDGVEVGRRVAEEVLVG